MSFITNTLVRLAGGAETVVRYGLGKLHIVPRASSTLDVLCRYTLSSKTVSLVRTELGCDELYHFVQPLLKHVRDACLDDSFCKRASADTFQPILSAFQSAAVAVTGFASDKLKDIAILSHVAKGASDISQWAFIDPANERAGLQTLFSLTIAGLNLTAGAVATLVALGTLKNGGRKVSSSMRAANLLMAAFAVVVLWGELQDLHRRAEQGMKACK